MKHWLFVWSDKSINYKYVVCEYWQIINLIQLNLNQVIKNERAWVIITVITWRHVNNTWTMWANDEMIIHEWSVINWCNVKRWNANTREKKKTTTTTTTTTVLAVPKTSHNPMRIKMPFIKIKQCHWVIAWLNARLNAEWLNNWWNDWLSEHPRNLLIDIIY